MAKQPRALSGKVAVITAGGRGIGKALAHALRREGVRVAIGDVDAQAAHDAAGEVRGGAVGLPLDVTDRPGFTAFLDDVEQRLGPIDILVNNAGIMPLATLDREGDAITLRQLELNLHAVIHGTREAIGRMRRAAPGTSSTSPRSRERSASRAAPPTAPASTAWSASPRRCASSCAARAWSSRS
jgi:NAD(P)-dependent dehydrogenase (short-subunit alcohol dehydrogenase family)